MALKGQKTVQSSVEEAMLILTQGHIIISVVKKTEFVSDNISLILRGR